MKKENIRLTILKIMSYSLLHFLIEKDILKEFMIEASKCNSTFILPKDGFSEIISYFSFSQSTTFSENKWYRYAFEYKQYYFKNEKLK